MQLQDLKPSILQMSAADVMELHRTIRENRLKRRVTPVKVAKFVDKTASILQHAEEADVDELDALIERMMAMKKG